MYCDASPVPAFSLRGAPLLAAPPVARASEGESVAAMDHSRWNVEELTMSLLRLAKARGDKCMGLYAVLLRGKRTFQSTVFGNHDDRGFWAAARRGPETRRPSQRDWENGIMAELVG